MFSANIKQFSIRHTLIASALVAFGMGLVCSSWNVTQVLGALVLVGVIGFSGSYVMMFISDLIDDGRIDERRWWSRCFNFLGLMIIVGTFLTVGLIGIVDLALLWDWLLDMSVDLELD